jgi:hypothetical protein
MRLRTLIALPCALVLGQASTAFASSAYLFFGAGIAATGAFGKDTVTENIKADSAKFCGKLGVGYHLSDFFAFEVSNTQIDKVNASVRLKPGVNTLLPTPSSVSYGASITSVSAVLSYRITDFVGVHGTLGYSYINATRDLPQFATLQSLRQEHNSMMFGAGLDCHLSTTSTLQASFEQHRVKNLLYGGGDAVFSTVFLSLAWRI